MQNKNYFINILKNISYYKLISALFFIFFSTSYSLEAEKKYETGILYGAISAHNDFLNLGETANCCPEPYDPGSGYSLLLPFNYYQNIAKQFYVIGGANFQYQHLDFKYFENQEIDGSIANLIHELFTDRMSFGITTGLSYDISKLSLSFMLNYNYLIYSVYGQKETLLSAGGLDSLGSKTRNIFENEKTSLTNSFIINGQFSASYAINLKKRLKILPTISYQFDVLNLHSDDEWRNTGIYFGFTIRYLFLRQSNPVEPN
jgi:hypothetical protein